MIAPKNEMSLSVYLWTLTMSRELWISLSKGGLIRADFLKKNTQRQVSNVRVGDDHLQHLLQMHKQQGPTVLCGNISYDKP